MTINDCYEILGQDVFASINEDRWTKAELNIRKLEISISVNGVYWDAHGAEKNMNVRLDVDTVKAIKRIHQITTYKKPDRWNRAKFRVTYEGKFEMDFIWDQELHDEVERLNKEARDARGGVWRRMLGWFGG